MSAIRSIGLSALLLATSAPVFAASAGEALQSQALPPPDAAAPALPGGAAALGGLLNPQALALLEQLEALQVTPQQALGGVGALLGLAQSQLAEEQYAQLAGSVPGIELLAGSTGNPASAGGGILGRLGALSGLLGGGPGPAAPPEAPLDSRAGVDQAFAKLGMESSLVGSFGQILLQFLAGQGLAGALLQSLGGIWGVPGALAPPVPATGTPVANGSAA